MDNGNRAVYISISHPLWFANARPRTKCWSCGNPGCQCQPGAVYCTGGLRYAGGYGGVQLSLGQVTLYVENMSAGWGWIAVVAVMLGNAHPSGRFRCQPVVRLFRCPGLSITGVQPAVSVCPDPSICCYPGGCLCKTISQEGARLIRHIDYFI